MSEAKIKRKRQRLSFVCTHCKRRKIRCDKLKPACSNCVRTGVECQYGSPRWINSSVGGGLGAGLETEWAPGPVSAELEGRSRSELYAEIEQLREAVKQRGSTLTSHISRVTSELPSVPESEEQEQQQQHQSQHKLQPSALQTVYPPSPSGPPSSDTQTVPEYIGFYDRYNALTLKNSSHEHYNPLCPAAVYRMDHYRAFFIYYMFLTLALHKDFLSHRLRPEWRSRHTDGSSKWIALLEDGPQDAQVRGAVTRLVKERASAFRSSVFPFIGLQDTDTDKIQYLVTKIREALSSKIVLDYYLDFFFKFIWPSKPFIDEDTFRSEVSRIISYETPTSTSPSINLSQRSDFAILATLLIILRYASVAVSLMDSKGKDINIESMISILNANPVSVDNISLAQSCLSVYKVLKKSTIYILEALLLLRTYFKDAPEDGDGLTLGQSQFLFGFIVQSAISMGLHRDPSNFHQTINNVKEANLRRRIWYSILSIDRTTTILSGSLEILSRDVLYDVKYPLIISIDPLEMVQRKEIEKNDKLQRIYMSISNMVNNLHKKTEISVLLKVLDDARNYVEEFYSLSSFQPLTCLNIDSKAVLAHLYSNNNIMEKQLVQASIEHTIYYLLCLHYESNAHLNVEKFKHYFKKSLSCSSKLIDLSAAYISGKLSNYLKECYNYSVLPLINTSLYRLVGFITGFSLRCFHVQDLLESPIFNKTEVQADEASIEHLVEYFILQYKNFLELYETKCGKKYYQSLKLIASTKAGFQLLMTHKFKLMNKMISFFENADILSKANSNDDKLFGNLKTKNGQRFKKKFQYILKLSTEWIQLNNSTAKSQEQHRTDTDQNSQPFKGSDAAIININFANVFLDFSRDDVNECVDVMKQNAKLCPEILQTKEESQANESVAGDSNKNGTGNSTNSNATTDNLYSGFSNEFNEFISTDFDALLNDAILQQPNQNLEVNANISQQSDQTFDSSKELKDLEADDDLFGVLLNNIGDDQFSNDYNYAFPF